MPPALWHLSLATGHGRRSPRSEVADDVLALLRPLVRLGHGTLRGLVIDLGPPEDGWRWFTLGWGTDPDVFCVVCWAESAHATAWAEALDHFRLAPLAPARAGFSEPPVPWLTADVLVGATERTPAQHAILGDAEAVRGVGAHRRSRRSDATTGALTRRGSLPSPNPSNPSPSGKSVGKVADCGLRFVLGSVEITRVRAEADPSISLVVCLFFDFACRRVYRGTVSSIRTLTVEEVATALRVARRTVYALLAEGALPVVRIGRAYRVDVEALRRFVRNGGRASDVARKRAHGAHA